MVFLIVVIIFALGTAGCVSGSMDLRPSPSATAMPTATITATPVPTPTSTAMTTPAASAASDGNASGPVPTMAPWMPGDDTYVPTATPDAGYSIYCPWFDENIQMNPKFDTRVVLVITGNVKNPLRLTMYNLSQYTQISITNHTYGAHHNVYRINASGASLNALLNAAQPNSDAKIATFQSGQDGYSGRILLSVIRSDPNAMIATRWSTSDDTSDAGDSNSLRNILPGQYYAQYWVYGLVSITVE